jgi:hypothetical protein
MISTVGTFNIRKVKKISEGLNFKLQSSFNFKNFITGNVILMIIDKQ